MKPKKIPMRMCVGCRESKPKRELIRVVRAPDGTWRSSVADTAHRLVSVSDELKASVSRFRV